MACAGGIPLDVENDKLRVPRLQRGGVLPARNPWIILPTDKADVGGFEQRLEALPALDPPKDGRAAPPYFVSRVHLIEGIAARRFEPGDLGAALAHKFRDQRGRHAGAEVDHFQPAKTRVRFHQVRPFPCGAEVIDRQSGRLR
jgi:hypothetical protein